MNYTTTTTTADPESLTLGKLREVMEAVRELGPEPIGHYMKAQGFDPDKGGRMMLPESMRRNFHPTLAPWYVNFSDWTSQPILYWDIKVFLTASVATSTGGKNDLR